VRIFIRGPFDDFYLEWHLVNNAVDAHARCKPTILAAIDAYAARGPERKSSVDHASYAGTARGARVRRGIVAGVSDLFVLHRGIAHMIEIKAEDGVLSDAQRPVADASRNEVSKPILRTRWLDGRGRKQLTRANKL
jgi:hypothetical protein